MARTNEFCCGFSLRTGTLILLWLTLIRSIYNISMGALYLSFYYDWNEKSKLSHPVFILILLIAYLVFNIAGFLIAILGLHGIKRNIAKYLTPYLYFKGLCVVGTILVILLGFITTDVYSIVLGLVHSDIPLELGLMLYSLILGLQIYFYVVIKSHRDVMRETAAGNYLITGSHAAPPYSQA